MLRVGLTGGAGGGKSTVAAILRELGAPVSQSDEIGRAMMQTGQPVYAAIVAHFGPDIVQADGSLNRAALAEIAFQQGRVDELNGIVHPAVIAAQAAWVDGIRHKNPQAVVVVESALLFETRYGPDGIVQPGESPWRTRFDRIVLVTAPEQVRLERYLSRQKVSEQGERRDTVARDARARFAAQMPEEEKAAMADFVLTNDGTPAELRGKVEALYVVLQREAQDALDESM